MGGSSQRKERRRSASISGGPVDGRRRARPLAHLALGGAACSIAGAAVLACDPDEGTVLAPVADLVAWDGSAGEQFGYDVAVHGNVAVIGANEDDDLGTNSGSAYTFVLDGTEWTQEQKLLASDGETGDLFGLSVDAWGDYIAVSAPREDEMAQAAGAVYIFHRLGAKWIERQKIVPFDGESWDAFGTRLAMDDGVLIVASSDDDAGENSGAAYVYRFEGDEFVFEQKLLASDAGPADSFGSDVAVTGALALVGADGSESAYVFRHGVDGWVEESRLVPADAGLHDEFGVAVDIDGDLAVVGARNHGNSGTGLLDGTGAVYVYRGADGAWSLETVLRNENGAAWDKMGHSVSVSDNLVVAGAPWDDDGPTNSGTAIVFGFNGQSWAQQHTLTNGVQGYADLFGSSR
jgi:hypothetical protein